MIEQILFFISFGNIFATISLDILNIEVEKDSDINKSENFNIDIQIYLAFKKEYKEFTIIKISLNTVKKDDKEYLYNKNNLYFEFNNIKHHNIIQMNCIYNYCTFYLGFKTINNFFLRIIFKLFKKAYKKEKTKYQIFTIKTIIYGTFISLFKYLSIYIKEEAILERY